MHFSTPFCGFQTFWKLEFDMDDDKKTKQTDKILIENIRAKQY